MLYKTIVVIFIFGIAEGREFISLPFWEHSYEYASRRERVVQFYFLTQDTRFFSRKMSRFYAFHEENRVWNGKTESLRVELNSPARRDDLSVAKVRVQESNLIFLQDFT